MALGRRSGRIRSSFKSPHCEATIQATVFNPPYPGSPLRIAHRGFVRAGSHENTLAAFNNAITLGCDMVELDVRMTGDGSLVCFHDNEVGSVYLGDLDHSGLCDLAGFDVPTLASAAVLCRGRIRMDVELKETAYEGRVIDTLLEILETDAFIVKSFDESTVAAIARMNRGVTVGQLLDRRRDGQTHPEPEAQCRAAREAGAAFVAPHHTCVTEELTAAAANHRLGVLVWTVNEPVIMRRLVDQGVDGIVTDRPDWLGAVLNRPRPLRRIAEIEALAADPDLGAMIDRLAGAKLGEHELPTRHVRIGSQVVTEVRDWTDALWGPGCRTAMIMDARTQAAVGNRLDKVLAPAAEITLAPLPGWDRVTPHISFVDRVTRRATDCDALIAVGSGTINDIVKYAATQLGKPYIVFATAASMNGYTSGVAALIDHGLKRTLPASPPVAALADVGVLARAPRALARAGYADLLSKPVSMADWILASRVRGEPFSEQPATIVHTAVARCEDAAEGIGRGEPAAVATLMKALILSGFSMALAGSSSPASGGEHLLSHYWDMSAYLDNREPALHGLQVAVGTVLTARLYERVRAADPKTFTPPPVRDVETLGRIHGPLWQAVRPEAEKQILSASAAAERLEHIRGIWPDLWRDLDSVLRPSEEIRRDLERASVSVDPAVCGIPPDLVRHALLHAADIRDRYTILHLARDIGLLDQLVADLID